MYNTVIIGAGQAGLSAGYYLKKLHKNFLIIDKSQDVGQIWQERYDSLVLFTSKQYSSLPGLKIDGEPNSLPTKDEVASYLKLYAKTFELPIQLDTEVFSIHKEGDYFSISTKKNTYTSKNIIIATGPFHKPSIPSFAAKLHPDVLQLHSSEYKNPFQLREGNVLVVGGGNSGAQIAVEVSRDRNTYLSTGQKLKFIPLHIGNRSIFWWIDKLGILTASSSSLIGKRIQKLGDPIFGKELKNSIRENKIKMVGRAYDATENTVLVEDSGKLEIQNVIWATGFKPDYDLLGTIPGIFNQNGYPLHNRGVSNIGGLFFLGLPWQYRRGSALLQGVGYDARYLVNYLQE